MNSDSLNRHTFTHDCKQTHKIKHVHLFIPDKCYGCTCRYKWHTFENRGDETLANSICQPNKLYFLQLYFCCFHSCQHRLCFFQDRTFTEDTGHASIFLLCLSISFPISYPLLLLFPSPINNLSWLAKISRKWSKHSICIITTVCKEPQNGGRQNSFSYSRRYMGLLMKCILRGHSPKNKKLVQ